MKRPVFGFEAEILTDAPCDQIVGRLREAGPKAFKCLWPLGVWAEPEEASGGLILRWSRTRWGAEESGELLLAPNPKGAHLHLRGRLKGWTGFLFLGLLRWRTDRLLDRFVEEL